MTSEKEGPAGQDGAKEQAESKTYDKNHSSNSGSKQASDGQSHGSKHSDRLDAALGYARRGWRVLPLHSIRDGTCTCSQQDCKSPGKHPRIASGVKGASNSESFLTDRWQASPDANIGIATGASSGIVVLDIDPRNGGDKSLAKLEAVFGSLPATLKSRTGGGGSHLYFKDPGGRLAGRANIRPGIDFKAYRGYVVAPPSIHESGKIYEFDDPNAEIAELPAWLLQLIQSNGSAGAQTHASGHRVSLDDLKISDRIKRLIRKGDVDEKYDSRSEAVFAALGAMIGAGYDDFTIWAVLLDPGHVLSERSRQKGPVWFDGEIQRARQKSSTGSSQNKGPGQVPPGAHCMADIEPEDVEWLWRPYIPRGKVTSIEGDPGVGKSMLTCAIVADLSRGRKLPGNQGPSEPIRALMLTAEDGLADTVRPRLEAFGADLPRIFAPEVYWELNEKGLARLEALIEEYTPDLVTIDPLVAYTGNIDLHRANEVRKVMAALADIAHRHNVAIVIVRHLTKSKRDRAAYRGQGSIDITASCRSVLMVGPDPEGRPHHVLAHVKCNLAPLGSSLTFTIDEGQFEWVGEATYSAEDLCGEAESSQTRSEIEEAVDFLGQILADDPVPALDCLAQAQALGISVRTLYRAKRKLGVKSKKDPDQWYWLPPQGGQPSK